MPPAPLLVREPYVQIDKLYHPNLGAMQYASFFKPPVAVTNVLGKVVEGQRL